MGVRESVIVVVGVSSDACGCPGEDVQRLMGGQGRRVIVTVVDGQINHRAQTFDLRPGRCQVEDNAVR